MKKFFPFIISYLIFGIVIAVILCKSIGNTGGNFFYTLDDPYIHMAIAKNFATSGTWGVTQYEFTSCSSSPLWTFLVSLSFFIFGVKDMIPLILNIIFATLTAAAVFGFIKKFTDNILIQSVILFFILFFTPFVSVVFTGLEHSMYSFLIVIVFIYSYKILKNTDKNSDLVIYFTALVLLTAARYEGMFVVFVLFLILIFGRKYKLSFLTLVLSFLPILIVGIISVSKGWYFFPNSVLLKSKLNSGDTISFLKSLFNPQFFDILWAYKRVLVMLVMSGVSYFLLNKEEENKSLKLLIIVFIAVTLLHINFAKMGSLLRYEMYIMTFGILLNSVLMIRYISDKSIKVKYGFAFLFLILTVSFSISTYKAVSDVPVASTNVYQMQYQMSRFINKYYKDAYIALNDIGVVNYYCDIHCLDMWGLADREVAELRRTGKYNTEEINRINKERKTEIVIIFDSWFEQYGGIPKNWYNSGTWRIQDNITCGSDVISFYALDETQFLKLNDNLWEFNSELNEKVLRNGEFIIRRISF